VTYLRRRHLEDPPTYQFAPWKPKHLYYICVCVFAFESEISAAAFLTFRGEKNIF